jgi:superfamily II DNA helicase RecQ
LSYVGYYPLSNFSGLLRRAGFSQFKNQNQAATIKFILQFRAHGVIISATGSGKTLPMHAIALLKPDSTTAIVIPYTALMTEHQQRADKLDLTWTLWTRQRSSQIRSNLLLLKPEDLSDNLLCQALAHLSAEVLFLCYLTLAPLGDNFL